MRFTGVLQDGTRRAPGVPANPATTIRIQQGADTVIDVQVVDSAGVPVNMNDDVSSLLALTVRTATGLQKVLSLCIDGTPTTPTLASVRQFVIPAAATKPNKLPFGPGRYVYDVSLTLNGSRSVVLPAAAFIIEAGVGLPP